MGTPLARLTGTHPPRYPLYDQLTMRLALCALLCAALVQQASALYFYLQAGAQKCFIEELPRDTIVVGHYKAEERQESSKSWFLNDQLGIQIVVAEVESGEKVVNTRGLPEGKFTFTSHEAGDHTICLQSNYTAGWFSTPQVRMHLDIAVGEAEVDEQGEQYQREREAEFRSLSDSTNSRAVWMSIIQIVVL